MSTPDTSSAERRLAMLQRLAELAMQMAESLAAEPQVTAESAMQFARIAKAVRQTIALEARLEGELEAFRAGAAQARHDQRRRKIVRTVERIIEAEPKETAWRLGDRFDDWRAENEDEAFGLERPFGEILAEICQALGVAPDLAAFAGEPWVDEVLAAFGRPPTAGGWPAEVLPGAAHLRPPDG